LAATQSSAAAAVTTPKQRQTTRTGSPEPARRRGRSGEAGPEPDASGAPFGIAGLLVLGESNREEREYRIGMQRKEKKQSGRRGLWWSAASVLWGPGRQRWREDT
jgi:hypothetical protein